MAEKGIASLAQSVRGHDGTGQHPLWSAMGGALGIIETIVPGFVFIAMYAFNSDAWLAIGASVAVSAIFTLYRLFRRQAATSALVGFAGVGLSAAFALWSNRPEDNFVFGLLTNLVYGLVFAGSVVVRRPLVGVIVNLIKPDDKQWYLNKHHYRVYVGVTLMWVALFVLRLAVEYPLYAAGNVGALAIAKLVLGLPLYAPVLALSWLIVRSLYREKTEQKL